MSFLVDTSVWSLALRRDVEENVAQVRQLHDAVAGADTVATTGLVLQALLQGFSGAKATASIVERFQALPLIQPDRQDQITPAAIRNSGRRLR